MTRLVLVRHGEPTASAIGTHYGQLDVELSEVGRAASCATAARLAGEPIAAVWSSDLVRAAYLAEQLAERLGLSVQKDPALRERHLGVFQGMTYAEGEAFAPAEAARMFERRAMHRPTAGENLADLRDRVLPAVARLRALHPAETVAVVAHGGPIRVILGAALGLSLECVERLSIDYCGESRIDFRREGDAPRVRCVNVSLV